MRSARGILGLPPFRLALSLVLIVATVTVATPNLLSLFAPASGERPASASTSALAAVEGWVTSHDGGLPLAGASVTLEGGPTATTDATGYFAFGTDDVASIQSVADSQAVPVTISVSAGGYSSWTIKSARYYAGDTLRVYPSLEAEGAGPRINIAAAPRGVGIDSMQPDVAGALSVSRVSSANAAGESAGAAPLLAGVSRADAGAVSAMFAPDAATWTPPASIRVYRTGTGVVEVVPFKEYVKHVLPNEWIPTWAPASLRAGALAVKEYAWYWVHNGGKQVALGADVKDNTEDQVYDPNVSYASTDSAVEATWPYALLRNGTLFQAQYCAGSYQADPTGDCPWGGSYYMTQWGSAYHADQGQTWEWIVQFYYNCAISGIGGGEPVPPPPAPPAPPPPTRVTTFSVGQGAVLPEVFVEAYERNGGKARLGNPTGAVRWWLPYVSEHNVLAQPFSGADSRNTTWLVFDTLKSEISDIRRAYLLEGGIGIAYAQHSPPGPEWVGAPTSDSYTAVTGLMSQGFARGTLALDGQNAAFAPWPTQFSGWEARYYVGVPPASSSGPQLDLPGQPALVADRPNPNMDWSREAGVPKSLGLGVGAWSAQFSKQAQFEAGTYDIALSADSGVRLWVDNLLAINAWTVGNHTEQYNLDLDGASHTIRVQYFSNTSAARLAFKMTRRDPAAPPAPPAPPAGTGSSGTVPGANPTGNAALRVKVRWLGRPDPPSDSWSQPLTLLLSAPGNPAVVGTYMGTTDRNGVAIYNGLPAGTYDVHVKGLYSLQSARAGIALSANRTTEVDMKAQVEGDLNGDNCVTVEDFAVVQVMVGSHKDTPGWNPRADLNNDGQVTAEDVSLLRSGFDRCGDISADSQFYAMSAQGAPTFEQQLAPWLNPASMSHDLALGMSAVSGPAGVGGIVEVQVYAETGMQAIDGGSFILYYDPSRLAPVDHKGNPTTRSEPGVALPSVLGNWIDTRGGAVGFAASMLQGTPPQGRVALATLRFRTLQAGGTELHFAPLSLGQMQITNGGANLLAKASSLSLTVNP
jgi:hypothetical protein